MKKKKSRIGKLCCLFDENNKKSHLSNKEQTSRVGTEVGSILLFAEDPSSVPSTNITWLLQIGGSNTLIWPPCAHICTHIHMIKNQNKKY